MPLDHAVGILQSYSDANACALGCKTEFEKALQFALGNFNTRVRNRDVSPALPLSGLDCDFPGSLNRLHGVGE